MKKIDFELMFNRLLDHMCELYDLGELCARLLEIGFDSEQLLELGFDIESVESGQEIIKEWEKDNE